LTEAQLENALRYGVKGFVLDRCSLSKCKEDL